MKKGVSLVTVLLFMMVATIAATATYKWLSSVGSSSAARLQISEARQAALSGIEAAQSWMTYKGNDLGAVIKQYFENGKKPILLNSVLPRMKSGKMLDSVWLMGVNAESSSRYTIKIVSQGTSRENVKYSEVAIFNVAGLYQAEIPSETRYVNYKDAFHGSLTTAGAINVGEGGAFIKNTPAVKNAKGQALNTIFVKDYLVWDGDFYANNGASIGDLYVTGDFSFLGGSGKTLNINKNLYVGGKVYGTSTSSHMVVRGSAYLNGGMKVNNRSPLVLNNGLYTSGEVTGGKFDFYGNVTSNGDIDHFNAGASASYIEMHENLVLNGKLVFPASASSNDYWIRVDRNAFIDENSTASGNIGSDYIPKTRFGSNVDDSLYLAGFEPHNGNNDCGSLFNCAKSTNGNIYVAYNGRLITKPSSELYKAWNADNMDVYRDMFSEERVDCGTSNISKDKLQFNEDILSMTSTSGIPVVHSANARNGCDEKIWEDNIEAPVEALNRCFNMASGSSLLVDKSWLVVSWDHAPVWRQTSEKLSGNFVFIINSTSAPTAEFELPETTDDAKALIYLPNGWKNTNGKNSLKTNSSSNARSNYFVYSADDIGGFNMQDSPLYGSIYMEGCSQLNSLGDNNTLAINFNAPLFRGLVKSLILCEYDGSHSCAPISGAVSAFDGVDPYQTMDSYFVATSPQLIVEVESQYRNNEPLPQTALDYETVVPSEVVLPRIIYLPRDAKGRFSDYYNVIGLNGLSASKNPANMQCRGKAGTIPTGESMLTSSGSELKEGKYLCDYSDSYNNKETTVPVFVVVEGSLNENATVQFHDDDVEKKVIPGGSTNVRLVATESDVPMTVTFSVDLPNEGGWHVEPIDPVVYNSDLDVYTITTTSSGENVSIPVFKVSSELENAAAGVFIRIKDCQKCILDNNQQAHVFTKNIATVQRKNINCNEIDEKEFKQKYGIECSKLDDIPSCGSLLDVSKTTWVTAHGLGCVPTEKNKEWECRTGGNEVELENKLSESAFCMAYIPPMSVLLKKPDSTYQLPAELKRKSNILVVKLEKPEGFSGSIKVKHQRENSEPVTETCSEGICIYDNLYAGDTVYFSKGSGRFSYYTCNGKSCGDYKPDEQISVNPFKIILVGGRDSVTAWFGQKDAHCFYTNFVDFYKEGWCPNSSDENRKQCIDRCKDGLSVCSVNDVNQYHSRNADVDWLMVRTNVDNRFEFPYFTNYSMRTPRKYIYDSLAMDIQLKFLSISVDHEVKSYGKSTVLLNSAKAGSNGLMTVMFAFPNMFQRFVDSIKNGFVKILASLASTFASTVTTVVNSIVSKLVDRPLMLDYGFVFRSTANGSEYFLLNVINDGMLKARLCYVDNQVYDANKCVVKVFPEKLMQLLQSGNLDGIPLTFNIDVNGDYVRLVVSKNFGPESGALSVDYNLKDIFGTALIDESHQYVGINLGHPWKVFQNLIEYEILDIGWRSYDYDENCWDTPKVSCSFKANYAGGMVPDSTDVTPWVGMSSWFDGKNCKVSYYYNGCDLLSEKMASPIPEDMSYHQILRSMDYPDFFSNNLGDAIACNSNNRKPRGNGLYSFSARELQSYKNNYGSLNDSIYWFKDEGYHGYPIEVQWDKNFATGIASIFIPNMTFNSANGVMNEASVIVSCESNEQNSNTHIYDASCGDFIVGEYERCTESYPDMLSSVKYCSTSSDGCFIELDSVYNVREATVSFVLNGFSGSQIEAYLVDEDGVASALGQFKNVVDGEYKIDVITISEGQGFNPQKLHGLLFKNVSYPFSVQRVWSKCPYEFNLTCNGASYSYASSEWTVSASVLNPDRAEGGCEVVLIADGYEVSDTRVFKQCSEDFRQEFQHEIYGQSQLHTYAFKVLARDGSGEVLDECTTEEKEIKPLEIECKLNESLDLQYVPQGTGVPQFSFKVRNCPEEGCPYKITYPTEFGLDPDSGSIESNVPFETHPGGSINTPDNKLSKNQDYKYMLDVMGHSCPGGNEFEVIGEPEKGTCTKKEIKHKDDGHDYFIANIDFDGNDNGYWNGTVKLVYTDYLGNLLGNVEPVTIERQTSSTLEYQLPDGVGSCNQGVCNNIVTLLLYGDDSCAVKWTTRFINTANNSSCLATPITDQDPSGSISFTPVISGCEDGNCSWTLKGVGVDVQGSGYNGSSTLTFSDPSAAGTKTYQFHVFANDLSATGETTLSEKNCSFNVKYKPEATQVTECFFDGSVDWGGLAKYSFTTNCANCSYTLKPASGSAITGKTSATAGAATEVLIDNLSKREEYTLTVNGKTIENCAKTPVFNDVNARCEIDKDELYDDESAIFKASFDVCKNGNGCNWTWELKRNEGNSVGNVSVVKSGNINSKESITQTVTGSGTYSLYLNGSTTEACEPIVVREKSFTPRVGTCSFDKSKYTSGSQIVFTVNGVNARKQSWSVKDDNGNVVASGDNLTLENQQYSPDLNFTASKDKEGVYKFCLSSGECCDGATLVVEENPPSLKCRKKKECNQFLCMFDWDYTYYLELTPSNCVNCKYAVKWGSSKTKQANVTVTKVNKVSNNQDVNCRKCGKINSDTWYQIILNGNNRELINCAEP